VALVSGADLDNASVHSARNTVVFGVKVGGQVGTLLAQFPCQGWFNQGYWSRNLLGLVRWNQSSAAAALNKVASAFAALRSSTALPFKWHFISSTV